MGPHRGYFIYYLIIATFSAGLSSFWVPQSPHLVPQARLPCLQLFTTLHGHKKYLVSLCNGDEKRLVSLR